MRQEACPARPCTDSRMSTAPEGRVCVRALGVRGTERGSGMAAWSER